MRETKSKKAVITREMGDWLNLLQWRFFVTLTFHRDDMSLFLSEQYFRRYLAEYPECVTWFYIIEMHSLRVSPHIHMLIGKTDEVKLWRHGIAKVIPYDSQLGASYYLTKNIASENARWDIKADASDFGRLT